MTGYQYTVTKGPPQQLGGPLSSGSVINNEDPTNDVWVSSQRNVRPGTGQRVPALGHVSWTADGAQPWVCVDTGVTTPVLMTVSDDVGSVDDPAGVAAATAAALFTSGIPFAIKEVTIADGVIVPAGSFKYFDVSEVASISVIIAGGQLSGATQALVSFWDETGTTIIDNGDYQSVSRAEWNVIGAQVRIDNITGPDFVTYITGSNRSSPARRESRTNHSLGATYSTGVVAMVAATRYDALQTFPNQFVLTDGQCYAYLSCSAGTKGRWEWWSDNDPVPQLLLVLGSTVQATVEAFAPVQSVDKMIALPAVSGHMRFYCTLAGNFSASMTIMPCRISG